MMTSNVSTLLFFILELVAETSSADLRHCSGKNQCHTYAICLNMTGSYRCFCRDGFVGDGYNNCHDIPECEFHLDNCHASARCINTVGSFQCVCPKGYVGDGIKFCKDVDECKDPTLNTCDRHNGQCINTIGSYTCVCNSGYVLKPNNTCGKDVDECALGTANCHDKASCLNTAGGYRCECLDGYIGDGKIFCRDIDECRDPNLNSCDTNRGICTNTIGSYKCSCVAGYVLHPNNNCLLDADKCDGDKTHDCHANAFCYLKGDGYVCDCKPGFQGNGRSCVDVNECSVPTRCHVNTVCFNLPGSYKCVCKSGYKRSGQDCEDIDECTNGLDRCSPNAQCINVLGSYRCVCRDGFIGNGVRCFDIDECRDPNLNSCDLSKQKCVNTVGNYKCQATRYCDRSGDRYTPVKSCRQYRQEPINSGNAFLRNCPGTTLFNVDKCACDSPNEVNC